MFEFVLIGSGVDRVAAALTLLSLLSLLLQLLSLLLQLVDPVAAARGNSS